MRGKKACPFCGCRRSWLRGKQGRGGQRYEYLNCRKRFSQRYLRGHHAIDLIRDAVNTYFDTRGSYRRTSKSIGYAISHTQLYRIVDRLGEGCKTPVEVAKELHPRW